MKDRIYLDNAATTALLPEVQEAMAPYFQERFGNPSSIHSFGRESRRAVDEARRQVAQLLDCNRQDVVFTASGTEAVHQALVGTFLAQRQRKHIVTTAIEHHAVLHTCEMLETLGAQVTYLMPDADGRVAPAQVVSALRPDTLLVSVMAVNNETGVAEDVVAMADAVKDADAKVVFHSDMVQALPVEPLHLSGSSIDMASFSAHKIHGPKGVGAMYLHRGTPWLPVLRGGNQEHQRRGGTENVPGIVGFGEAAAVLQANFGRQLRHLQQLAGAFWEALEGIPGVYRVSPKDAVPTIVNLGFEGIPQDVLLMRLDLDGVAASAGSACTAGSLEPSHVLQACGLPQRVLREAVRFSFSALTTKAEVMEAARRICAIVERLRQ